ncbi:MAG: sigma 54-interacting transcriptional regulator [Kiritimatiellia bacterium]
MRIKPNPITELYKSTDIDLRNLLQPHMDSEPLARATVLLLDYIEGQLPGNVVFLTVQRTDVSRTDSTLCLLFLTTWAEAAGLKSVNTKSEMAEAWSLLRQAQALISDRTSAELVACIRCTEARLFGLHGNISRCEAALRAAIDIVPRESPRRRTFIFALGSLLAQLGRLSEIETELTRLEKTSASIAWISRTASLRFVNSIETGRFEEATQWRAGTKLSNAHSIPLAPRIEKYQRILELFSGKQNQGPENVQDLPDWALALRCLLMGNSHQALRWARLCEKMNPETIAGIGLTSFNLIRAELAEGNVGAARRLLDLRRQQGNTHYLDDFFLARADILEGNPTSSAPRFVAVLQAAERHNATARLEMELRLALEMPRDRVFRLTLSAHPIRSVAHSTPRSSLSVSSSASEGEALSGVHRLIGTSTAMENLRRTVIHLAPLGSPLIITGETGTGKELVARALHEESPRREAPFIAVNCGTIPESLLESELFGHEKGAFSGATAAHRGLFEEAGEGTLLLDEMGDVPPRLQSALLRVLESGEIRPVGSSRPRTIRCRIIAATNADLRTRAAEGRFRSDVLFRLCRLEIHIPPLRERRDDIIPLATYFLNLGRPAGVRAVMTPALGELLMRYPWPGNVRELRNAIERMRIMNSDKLHYDIPDLELEDASALTLLHRCEPIPASLPESQRTQQVFLDGSSTVRRLTRLRELFRSHRLLTRAEVVAALGVSPNTATRDLQLLCREGLIEKKQPTASPRSAYFVLREDHPTTP